MVKTEVSGEKPVPMPLCLPEDSHGLARYRIRVARTSRFKQVKARLNNGSYLHYTGRFILYSGITKICYRKTVGHVFTKPVQIEGTTQKFFSLVSCFSSQFTFLPLGDAIVCSEEMAALGEKSFCVLEYHTRKSVVTVQPAFRAKYSSHHCLQQ